MNRDHAASEVSAGSTGHGMGLGPHQQDCWERPGTPSEYTLTTLTAQTPPHPGLRLPGLGLLEAPIPEMSILYFPIMTLGLGDLTAGL